MRVYTYVRTCINVGVLHTHTGDLFIGGLLWPNEIPLGPQRMNKEDIFFATNLMHLSK